MAGNSRITVPCVQLISSLRSRHASTTAAPSIDSSMPIIRPTHPHLANKPHCFRSAVSRWRKTSLIRRAFSRRWSCSIVSMVAMPGPGGDGVAAEGGRVHPRTQAGGQLGRASIAPPASAAAQGLGQGHHVGRDAEMLVGEPLAGPAAAGLHLVENQQQLVLVGQPPQARPGSRRAG